MSTVELVADSEWVKVRIGGRLHLSVKRDELGVVQSWYTGDEKQNRLYWIEFTTSKGQTVAVYESEELWAEILEKLDRV